MHLALTGCLCVCVCGVVGFRLDEPDNDDDDDSTLMEWTKKRSNLKDQVRKNSGAGD